MQIYFKHVQIYSIMRTHAQAYLHSWNKYICKNRPQHSTHIQGATLALQPWFKTTFTTFNKHLCRTAATYHFNTFFKPQNIFILISPTLSSQHLPKDHLKFHNQSAHMPPLIPFNYNSFPIKSIYKQTSQLQQHIINCKYFQNQY